MSLDKKKHILLEQWGSLDLNERLDLFKQLPRSEAEQVFLNLNTQGQVEMFLSYPDFDRRSWLRTLPPDDIADIVQYLENSESQATLELLDTSIRQEVEALLHFKADQAGGLMNPRFIRLRPNVTCEVALRYYRMQSRTNVEFGDYAFVLDEKQKLLGLVTLRDLLRANPEKQVQQIMKPDVIWVDENDDQEEIGQKFLNFGIKAIPVCDKSKIMKGIVTIDDIMDVIQQEASEDMQKLGGSTALEKPYLSTTVFNLIKGRLGWLVLLFLGQMFTASVMSYHQGIIASIATLAIFIPMIISSGGNSGSQAASLMIRSLAVKELSPKDWLKVLSREVLCSFSLGLILGGIGRARIVFWPFDSAATQELNLTLGLAVGLSILSVVVFGSLMGALLPLFLSKIKLDPATASAPLVATIVDITGISIYFSVASLLFHSILSASNL